MVCFCFVIFSETTTLCNSLFHIEKQDGLQNKILVTLKTPACCDIRSVVVFQSPAETRASIRVIGTNRVTVDAGRVSVSQANEISYFNYNLLYFSLGLSYKHKVIQRKTEKTECRSGNYVVSFFSGRSEGS